MESIVDKALRIALSVHSGQTDKGGHPYILHPLRIMKRLNTPDEELMAIALLHDAVEDSGGKLTFETLYREGFSERVVGALRLLTHGPTDDYQEYIRGIAANRDATLVKLQDLRDNSDVTRLKGLREKDFKRLAKYATAYNHLQQWGVR